MPILIHTIYLVNVFIVYLLGGNWAYQTKSGPISFLLKPLQLDRFFGFLFDRRDHVLTTYRFLCSIVELYYEYLLIGPALLIVWDLIIYASFLRDLCFGLAFADEASWQAHTDHVKADSNDVLDLCCELLSCCNWLRNCVLICVHSFIDCPIGRMQNLVIDCHLSGLCTFLWFLFVFDFLKRLQLLVAVVDPRSVRSVKHHVERIVQSVCLKVKKTIFQFKNLYFTVPLIALCSRDIKTGPKENRG